MKRIVKEPVAVAEKEVVKDVEGGFVEYLGKDVTVLCDSYFYTGRLSGVNGTFIELENASIIYETGDWAKAYGGKYQRAEKLPCDKLVVLMSKVETLFENKASK
jgi:hypothetical protein